MKKGLIPLMMGGIGIGTTEFLMMGILPNIAKSLSISIPDAGHLISAYALGVVIGAPLLTAIAGNYKPKQILLAFMILFTAFNGLAAFSHSYTLLFIARLFAGLPHGAFFGIGSVVAQRLADKGKETQAVSMMFAGLTIANLLGVPLGTYIGNHFDWRYSFGMIAGIGVLTILSLVFLMPDLENTSQRDLKKELAFFKLPKAWLIIAIIAIGTGGLFCWISYISPLATTIGGFQKSNMTYIMMFAGGAMFIGNIFGAKLSDKLNPRNATMILLLSMTISLLYVHFFSVGHIGFLIGTFLTSACAFALIAPVQLLMIREAKGAEMLAAAASQAAFNIGNALGAFLGAIPIEKGLDYSYPALVGVVMAFIGFGLCFLIKKRKYVEENILA